jgi:hypothetical protein
MNRNQSGFAHIALVLVVLAVVGLIGFIAFRVIESNNTYTASNAEQKATTSEVKIKAMPITIDYYDPATNKAGDIEFTKDVFDPGVQQMLFSEFGYKMPGRPDSIGSPQPTFIVPKGTLVHALIDGEVVNIPTLHSGDFSVHMQGEGSELIFETEHLIDVRVKVGDKLKAGDVVGVASDYDAKGYNGRSLIEIGVLKSGNPPNHLCTFDYLDDSIKQDTLDKIDALKKSWEEYRGDPNAYGDNSVIPGCVTHDPIQS